MLRTLLDIAMNWTVRGKDLRHVRCRRRWICRNRWRVPGRGDADIVPLLLDRSTRTGSVATGSLASIHGDAQLQRIDWPYDCSASGTCRAP